MGHARPMPLALIVLGVAMLLAFAVTGCDGTEPLGTVGDAVEPAPWDLSTPELAVRSYLDWVSFSYRMANSEIPTATMTPEEAVRVDSYIQLNRMDGKGLEQFLTSLEITFASQEASTAVVTAHETWRYRYFSLETLEYLTEEYMASYDTTYTLVAQPQGWLVDAVEATSNEEVK
ncbi:MAG: hypothetical protein Q7W51_06805 [Coriobacteriia bacterium]|nr:hypothetical protein [Coriobacteriia bacterium]